MYRITILIEFYAEGFLLLFVILKDIMVWYKWILIGFDGMHILQKGKVFIVHTDVRGRNMLISTSVIKQQNPICMNCV